MGFFDGLSDRYRAWKAERREKREKRRYSTSQISVSPRSGGAAAQTPNDSHNRQRADSRSGHTPRGGNAQQVSPATRALDEDAFGGEELALSGVEGSSGSGGGGANVTPTRAMRSASLFQNGSAGSGSGGATYTARLVQCRSISPTSLPQRDGDAGSSAVSSPYRGGSAHAALGSSPSSGGLGFVSRSHLHPPLASSGSGSFVASPTRGFIGGPGLAGMRGASSASQLESKEDDAADMLVEEIDGLNISASSATVTASRPALVGPTPASSSAARPAVGEQTEDERLAELLQQEEYLHALQESGEIGDINVASLSAQVTAHRAREARHARRRERRAMEAARGLPETPHTPSPGPDEGANPTVAAAAAAFTSFQARAQAAASPRSHVLSSSVSASSLHSPAPRPPLAASVSLSHLSPSRSQSYSTSFDTPGASALGRARSLSRSELNSLPVFAYVPSPQSLVARARHLQQHASEDSDTLFDAAGVDAAAAATADFVAAAPAALIEEESTALDSCSICLGDYETDDQLRCLPCMCKFHASCVDDWLSRSSVCPLCTCDARVAF